MIVLIGRILNFDARIIQRNQRILTDDSWQLKLWRNYYLKPLNQVNVWNVGNNTKWAEANNSNLTNGSVYEWRGALLFIWYQVMRLILFVTAWNFCHLTISYLESRYFSLSKHGGCTYRAKLFEVAFDVFEGCGGWESSHKYLFRSSNHLKQYIKVN